MGLLQVHVKNNIVEISRKQTLFNKHQLVCVVQPQSKNGKLQELVQVYVPKKGGDQLTVEDV